LAIAAILSIDTAIVALLAVEGRETIGGRLVKTKTNLGDTIDSNTIWLSAKILDRAVGSTTKSKRALEVLPTGIISSWASCIGGGSRGDITTPWVDGGDINIGVAATHVKVGTLFLRCITNKYLIISKRTIAGNSIKTKAVSIGENCWLWVS